MMKEYKLKAHAAGACGGWGQVYVAEHATHRSHVALRIVPLDAEELEKRSKIELQTLIHEVCVLKCVKHAQIIQLLDAQVVEKHLFMAFPFMDFGSVDDLLNAHAPSGLPELAIAYILSNVLQAIQYLHLRNIIHRSIKGRHILLSSSGAVRLSGLRNARSMIEDGQRQNVLHDFSPEFKQNLLWLAPEVLQQDVRGYSLSSDIYSLGIAICEMANGFPPFDDMCMMQMLFEKLRGTTPRLLDQSTLPMESTSYGGSSNDHWMRQFSTQLHNLTEECLRPDAHLRPSATSLIDHSFFHKNKQKKVEQFWMECLGKWKPFSVTPKASQTKLDHLDKIPEEENELDLKIEWDL